MVTRDRGGGRRRPVLRSGLAERADIAVIGAGAAGLMAAIAAGRAAALRGRPVRVIAVDGARTLGAKILVAGGGRCNVTHHAVDAADYACGPGTTRAAIGKVLRSFGVPRTVGFFRELGVELKREETGKLFPTTDRARTVLEALLRAAGDSGVELRHPWRVESVMPAAAGGFSVRSMTGELLEAARVILATGGMALPRSGSDGHGYSIARALGHSITEPVFPALVPLLADASATFLPSLSGLTHTATLTLWSGSGRKLVEFTDSMLCTHFGLSGPAVLNISRYWLDARRSDDGAVLSINWMPGSTFDDAERALGAAFGRGRTVLRVLADRLPERLTRALAHSAGVDAAAMLDQLRREQRRALAHALTRTIVPVTGDRGFTFAEATAGGVPLSELRLESMESRPRPGLHICGEICDVDGRIGGFNFQWAWASGHAAGIGAAAGVAARGSIDTPPQMGHPTK